MLTGDLRYYRTDSVIINRDNAIADKMIDEQRKKGKRREREKERERERVKRRWTSKKDKDTKKEKER